MPKSLSITNDKRYLTEKHFLADNTISSCDIFFLCYRYSHVIDVVWTDKITGEILSAEQHTSTCSRRYGFLYIFTRKHYYQSMLDHSLGFIALNRSMLLNNTNLHVFDYKIAKQTSLTVLYCASPINKVSSIVLT
jgi:hypothetical protein